MSSSTPENAIDELDLSDLFSLLKRWLYSALALVFKAIDFLFKYWWIVLILIVVGAVLGKFTMSPTAYKATVIVKTNFESQSYTYNAVEQLGLKISDQDSLFISENKLGGEDAGIIDAEITPIIDVSSLIEGVSSLDSRSLNSVLKELAVDDEVELFASERFYSNYAYHKLEIFLKNQDKTYVNRVIDYINNQPTIQEIKNGYVKNMEERITANDKMLSQIDVLIKSYTDNIGVVSKNAERLSYYNNQNNININGALTLKKDILTDNEDLKNQQITSTNALVALSDIQIVEDSSLTDKKYIIYPVLLVFIFCLFAGVRFIYRTLRRQLVDEKFLD